jgi:hypothetical protein
LLKIGRPKMDFLKYLKKNQGICWDIYYFSERLRCRLSKKLQTFSELQL